MTDTSNEEENGRHARDDRARASFGPFDPLGTISELQAQGIRAASDIAHGLTNMLDAAVSTGRPQTAGPNGNGRANVGDLRGAVGRLIDLYGDVLGRTFDAYADLLEERARMGPHLDGGPAGAVQVTIAPGGERRSGAGELWLGNGTDATTGKLRLVSTALVSADGYVPVTSVLLEPNVVDAIAPGDAARIAVAIEVEPDAPEGYYHGYVLVPELPGEALPLTLVVGYPSAEDGVP